MFTLADDAMPPARDGLGRALIADEETLAECRALLHAHPMVRAADGPWLTEALEGLVRFYRYVSGYAVMSAGETADRVGLVLAGRCRVWHPDQRSRSIAWVGAGEVLGEMTALTGGQRAVTVGAVRDTILAEFDVAALAQLEDRLARLTIEAWLSRLVARRALGAAPRRPPSTVLALLGADPAQVKACAALFAQAAGAAGVRLALRSLDDWPDGLTVRALEEAERAYDVVVLVDEGGDPLWSERVVREADRVLVVADGTGDAGMTAHDLRAATARVPHILVLLQPAGIERATDTARWLTERTPMLHLHIRRGDIEDAARCIRLVTGRGRGVAFAGASSRGLGYTGIIAAFEELSLVPDIIGGNSSGSMAAGCLAVGYDSARTGREFQRGFESMRPGPRNATLPFVALLTGGGASRFFRSCFGDVLIEDLLTPCILTAVDLSTLALVELRQGPLWRAVRASTSLPAYYPPVVTDHRVLVDGGVLQNVPVHPLSPLCRDGFVVIGDLSQDPEGFTEITPYGSEVSGWRLLLRRLWPFGRRPVYPMMHEVIFRTACLASLRNQAELVKQLDPSWLYIRPDTPPIGLFGATPEQIPRLVDDTRRQTLEQLLASERPAVRAAITRP